VLPGGVDFAQGEGKAGGVGCHGGAWDSFLRATTPPSTSHPFSPSPFSPKKEENTAFFAPEEKGRLVALDHSWKSRLLLLGIGGTEVASRTSRLFLPWKKGGETSKILSGGAKTIRALLRGKDEVVFLRGQLARGKKRPPGRSPVIRSGKTASLPEEEKTSKRQSHLRVARLNREREKVSKNCKGETSSWSSSGYFRKEGLK